MYESLKNHESENNNWNLNSKPDVEAALVKWILEDSKTRKYRKVDKQVKEREKEKALDNKEERL